jgi:glycosyltransferase involved in cell wall biosynthesis
MAPPFSISVVIPAYNAEKFIAETLSSVLAQTYPPAEVLVLDDGSTDSTASIAESFPAPVRVVRKTNSGQANTRNFGVQSASCDWVAFLDADDLWLPDKLARQVEELARNPAASLCYTARTEFTQNGDVRTLGVTVPVPPPSSIRRALFRNTTFLPSAVLVRRSVFLDAGGFDTAYKIVEDWDLWLRLLHANVQFAAVPEPLLLYRIHPESVSHKGLIALAAQKAIFRRHVLPYLPRTTRWLSHQISQSGQESAAAYILRKTGDPRYFSMMATSIARYPFNNPHRYKVLAHMLYTRFHSRGKTPG